jgi:hypothetical protein
MAREVSGLAARPLDFPGGVFVGEVEAAGAPSLKREGDAWAISVPIGGESPIACFLYDKAIDGAASMVRFIRLLKEGAKGLAIQGIIPTDVGVIGETAYAMVAVSYTVASPRGTAGGLAKMMVRPDVDAPLLCFHDEIGYVETFKRVTQRLALSLKPRQPTPPPAFVEVHVIRLGDIPVGFDRRTIVTDAHGVKYDQTVSCQLLPRSAQDLSGTDSVETERSDASGRLIQLDSVEIEGEEIESQFRLTRQGTSREYAYEGKQSGKAVSGRFKAKEKDGLPSSLLVSSRLRATLLTGKTVELRVEEYHPSLAPEPLEVIYRRKGDGGAVTMSLGQLQASGRLDERGMVDQMSMPIGGTTMRQERVLVRGTP